MSEVLRIARNTLNYDDFIPTVSSVFSRMKIQGGNMFKLSSTLSKLINKYPQEFIDFNVPFNQIIEDIYGGPALSSDFLISFSILKVKMQH